MAGFKMHVSTSSLLGVAYGGVAYSQFDMPLSTSVLSAGLCGVSGMLPDLDSGPGIPLRESVGFAAAVVPIMLFDRLQYLGWPNELIVIAGAGVYLLVRFGLSAVLQKFTVHRGMYHSLPAMLIAGEIAFLLASGDLKQRLFKASAVMCGFLSHLLLDEIYSVQWKALGPRLKSSFGTAVKLWGDHWGWNLFTYGILLLLGLAAFNDPIWVHGPPRTQKLHNLAAQVIQQVEEFQSPAENGEQPRTQRGGARQAENPRSRPPSRQRERR